MQLFNTNNFQQNCILFIYLRSGCVQFPVVDIIIALVLNFVVKKYTQKISL